MCTDHSQPSSAVLCNKTKHMSLQPFTISRWYGDTHRYTTQLKFKYARDLLLKAIQPFGATTGFHVEQLSLTLLRCYSKIYKVSPGLKPVASTFLTADSLFSPQLLHSALVDKETFFPFFFFITTLKVVLDFRWRSVPTVQRDSTFGISQI